MLLDDARETLETDIGVVNPFDFESVSDRVLSSFVCSVFHTFNWAHVLFDTYGYHPHYIVSSKGGDTTALLPMMEVGGAITKRRGVSLPFSDYCEPIVSDRATFEKMVEKAIAYASKRGWRNVEFRGGQGFFDTKEHFARYWGHRLNLEADFEHVLSTFRDSTRRNIRGAERAGVEAEILNSLAAVKEYYKLHCGTRKYQGLPPQPWTFFKNIHKHLISAGHGFVVLATYQGDVVAGAVFLHFGGNAIYKYGASKREYQSLRANNLVMWKAIRWYCENGYRSLSFGRTDMDNEGLRQFKKGWGAKEYLIKYYCYDVRKGEFLREGDRRATPFTGLFRRMPMSLLRTIGWLAYKHMG
jgi:hypothetical protein